jgi:thioredoxin-dependent peroxiredoxin
MAHIVHAKKPVQTAGDLPAVGTIAPDFRLTDKDFYDFRLSDFKGKKVVLNIFPSIDTSACARTVRKFNLMGLKRPDIVFICISKDSPMAFLRFCENELILNVKFGSELRDKSFSSAYNVEMISGTALTGLFSRAVVVISPDGVIEYTEQVQNLSDEPSYKIGED